MNLKKIGKVFTSKFVGTGPLSYEKRIYRAAVSQRLRNTDLDFCDAPLYSLKWSQFNCALRSCIAAKSILKIYKLGNYLFNPIKT